ncbi:MAG: hypothetical protein HQ559_01975 [Lentisphaerae bacterium]|nr:hypothetical protein [Lentisphaerota bacterium]
MTSDTRQNAAINASIRRAFNKHGVDLDEVWAPMSDDTELENRQLAHLLDWLMTYREHPHRAQMEAMGYVFPPVEPDIDPDTDWIRFERWAKGAPLQWSVHEEYGPIREASAMSDGQLEEEFERLVSFLADRRVDLSLEEDVPTRVKYMHVKRMLENASFDHMEAGSCCVVGCGCYCPDCLQRPWCDLGMESDWEQEDRDGRRAVPAEVLPHVPQRDDTTGDGADKETASSLFFAFAAG